MPDWALNVVKIFIREEHQHLADEVISLFEGKDDSGEPVPLDFRKIFPVPSSLIEAEKNDLGMTAKMVLTGRWPKSLGERDEAESLETSYSKISPKHADILAKMKSKKEAFGVYNALDWRSCAWGVKGWGSMREPDRDLAENYTDYFDYPDCTFIKYVFDTPWSAPLGIYKRLEAFCRKYGFGMKAWVSGGGSTWNPITGEYQEAFEEIVNLGIEEMSMSDKLLVSGGDLEIDDPLPEELKISEKTAKMKMVDFA